MSFFAGQRVTAAALNAVAGELILATYVRGSNTSTFTTTETAWATSGSLTLPASSAILVVAKAYWASSATSDQLAFRLRDTNVAGTQRNIVATQIEPQANGGPFSEEITYAFATTTSVSYVACATAIRLAGTGNATVNAQSSLTIKVLGPSSILNTI
jgi:hypothetical protein